MHICSLPNINKQIRFVNRLENFFEHPYINNQPKCLQPVGGKTIIDRIVDDSRSKARTGVPWPELGTARRNGLCRNYH